VILALLLIAAFWAAFVWEATTGVTVAGRRNLGRNSSPQHLASTRRNAITGTFVFGAVAVGCYLVRRSGS
jgi:hypothetical protein